MRGALIRNIAAAVVNGAITLAILLIAPLGLAAVITNTVFISVATFLVCTGGDLVVFWLLNTAPGRRDFPRFRDRYRDNHPSEGGLMERNRYEEEDQR